MWGVRNRHEYDRTGAETHVEMVDNWLSQLAAAHSDCLALNRCAEVPWAVHIRELLVDSPHPNEALDKSVKLALGVT